MDFFSITNFIGKGEGIVIARHVAGHLLGGTVWKITKDGEDVIYAVDFNRRKEKYICYLLSDPKLQFYFMHYLCILRWVGFIRHLNGTVLESFVRPAVLITDAYNALNNQPPKQQRQRDIDFVGKLCVWCWILLSHNVIQSSFIHPIILSALMHFNACTYGHTPNLMEILSAYTISKTLEAGGNVLLPVDTAGCVLEILLVLEEVSGDTWVITRWIFLLVFWLAILLIVKFESWYKQHWSLKSLNFPIFFLTYVAPSTIDYVKSFLEWMSDAIAKSFETSRDNAFLLK